MLLYDIHEKLRLQFIQKAKKYWKNIRFHWRSKDKNEDGCTNKITMWFSPRNLVLLLKKSPISIAFWDFSVVKFNVLYCKYFVVLHSNLDITNLDIVNFVIYVVNETQLSSHFEDLLSILHLIEWIIQYSEQKGSDRLVHYIEVWVYRSSEKKPIP